MNMRELYPEIEPYAVHALEVGDGHFLHVEESGNRDGSPVLFLHGGPGSGCKAYHRRFFDPARYRAILFDQRGAGRSEPFGELNANTTPHLLGDMERIRHRLRIDNWLLFGGSWGSTLALLYAEKHPRLVMGLVLRGVFLARRRDLEWFTGDGVRRIYPESWRRLESLLPPGERHDPIPYIHAVLSGADELARWRMAREWLYWGGQVALGEAFEPAHAEDLPPGGLQQARIEAHYAAHGYFIGEDQILHDAGKIAHIPTLIVQGRHDFTCPVEGADTLHRALPKSTLEIIPQGGHIAGTPDMIDALVRAADAMAERLGTQPG
jgi:proline iminopeptidase